VHLVGFYSILWPGISLTHEVSEKRWNVPLLLDRWVIMHVMLQYYLQTDISEHVKI
jgi:hypothetical protein